MTYRNLRTARGIARRFANQTGEAWAVLGRDGLGVLRWEIFPARLIHEGEYTDIIYPNFRESLTP